MENSSFYKLTLGLAVTFVVVWLSVAVVMAGELEPLYPHYPTVFDVTGEVYVISSDSIVINDASYDLLSSVVYYGPWGEMRAGGITPDSIVGCVVQEGEKVESVWLLKKMKKPLNKKNVP